MKRAKKYLATVLTLCMVLQSIALGVSIGDGAENKDKKPDSTYSFMYDSNEKLSEELEKMPEFVDIQQTKEKKYALLAPINEQAGYVKDSISDLAKTGRIDEIEHWDLSNDMKTKIRETKDSVEQDHFIVKYQSEEKGNIPSLLEKKDKRIDVAQSERVGRMETIVLEEKVNPRELAETLEKAGANKYIEYIQPDFQMELSSIDEALSLELTNGETREKSSEAKVDVKSGESTSTEENTNKEHIADNKSNEKTPAEKTEDKQVKREESDTSQVTSKEAEMKQADSTVPQEKTEEERADQGPPETVVVAVIDAGIDISHPELAHSIWSNGKEIANDGIDNDGNGYVDDVNGWNFVDKNSSVYDTTNPLQSAHGTHIAGIIAGLNQEKSVKIMPLKVFGNGGAYTSDILDAIDYAKANGAKIVNCSFGSTNNNPALKEKIEESGMLFVCAVGNARSNLNEHPVYPACFEVENVMSVTSTNADGGLSYYSNYSPKFVDVAGSGRDINSTLPNGEYGKQSGTSMAAAQVSGVAAVTLSAERTLDAMRLKERLLSTSVKLSNLQNTVANGRQINLENAVNDIEQTEILGNSPKDDFSVEGYHPTQSELNQLYSNSGDVVQVEAGALHTLVLKKNGTVWAWGNNRLGECGNGEYSESETLTQVVGLSDIIQIDVSGSNCLALKSDGTVWEWGAKILNQTGQISPRRENIPLQINNLTNVIKVSAGDHHSLALKSDGTVWLWADWIQMSFRSIPVMLVSSGAVDIAAGDKHSVFASSSGRAYEFDLIEQWMEAKIVEIPELDDVVKVSAGDLYSQALKSDGTVWVYNRSEQTESSRLYQALNMSDVIKIASYRYYSVALKSDGTVWEWYFDPFWSSNAPHQFNTLCNIVDIDVGYGHTVALKSDGTVWAWGSNGYGQLGRSDCDESNVPVQSQIQEPEIHFMSSNYTVTIPGSGASNLTVNVQAKDNNGNVVENPAVIYNLVTNYDGIRIDSSTGVITVSSDAAVGSVQIKAVYGTLSCTTTLMLKKAGEAELSIPATKDQISGVQLTGSQITSFEGRTFTLTYDPTVLELTDLCALTYDKELTAGEIARTGIKIESVAKGQITFSIKRSIPSGKAWTGVLNTFQFKALSSKSAVVSVK